MTGVTALSRPVTEARAPIDLRDVAIRAAALKRYSVARAGLTIAFEPGDQPLLVHGQRPATAAGRRQPDRERRAGA